jgi:hypothetical protein
LALATLAGLVLRNRCKASANDYFDLAAHGAGQQFSLISVAFLHEKLLN